jgi:hypothetical protein
MRGFYRIYKGDTLVCEQNNALTVVGRSLILKSLLGLIPSVGGSIAIGVHNQANPALNSDNLIDLNTMSFSIGQSPVQLATLDRTDNVDALVFKTTINDPLKYTIYEVGLYPESIQDQIVQFADLLLFNGESDDGWTEGSTELSSKTTGSRMISGDLATAGYRIGNEAVYIDSGSTVFSTVFSKNFTNFSDKDLLKLAVDPTGVSGTLAIKFETDDTNFYSKTFTISPTKTNAVTAVTPSSPAVGSVTYAATGHTFATGDVVTITGSSVAGYNGTFVISSISQNTFTVINATTGAATFTSGLATVTGYQILSCAKDEILATGTPSWENINKVSITMTSTGLVLDGIKFDDTDNVDVNYGLVSRTALATPIQKSAGEPITIEYYLVLAFNEVIA